MKASSSQYVSRLTPHALGLLLSWILMRERSKNSSIRMKVSSFPKISPIREALLAKL